MTAPLPYLVIILKVIELEKASFSDMKNLITVLNRDNLTQPIQMQLSQKQKAVFESVFAFSKFTLNFKHFQKKDDLQS